MKQKKVGLIKRIKKAIIDFDYYKNFAEEKISISIKYIMKLVLILSLIVVGIFMCAAAGIWSLIEGIMILAGSINKDAKGNPLSD